MILLHAVFYTSKTTSKYSMCWWQRSSVDFRGNIKKSTHMVCHCDEAL